MNRKEYLEFLQKDIEEAMALPKGVTMDPKEIEERSAELYKAPRISLSDIEAEIASVAYMSGFEFLTNAEFTVHKDKVVNKAEAEIMTICLVTMKNGWMLVGMSAPASPENYDKAHGQKLAYDRCIMQIWPLMGYMLKEQLHNTK